MGFSLLVFQQLPAPPVETRTFEAGFSPRSGPRPGLPDTQVRPSSRENSTPDKNGLPDGAHTLARFMQILPIESAVDSLI
jgi:hypothetical protein